MRIEHNKDKKVAQMLHPAFLEAGQGLYLKVNRITTWFHTRKSCLFIYDCGALVTTGGKVDTIGSCFHKEINWKI